MRHNWYLVGMNTGPLLVTREKLLYGQPLAGGDPAASGMANWYEQVMSLTVSPGSPGVDTVEKTLGW